MLGILFSIMISLAVGVGVWAMMPAVSTNLMADKRAEAVAELLYEQHQAAVRWVSEEDDTGVRVNASFEGEVTPPTDGAVSYNFDNYGHFTSYHGLSADGTEWATITYITPAQQDQMKSDTDHVQPQTVLRDLVTLSDKSRYTIGIYQNGHVQPLDLSSTLQAPSNTTWSPMDPRDPTKITNINPNRPGIDKPVTQTKWITGPEPDLNVVPPGMVEGSMVIVTPST